jgi:FKBP-type peptidyl-prolyl cis-trans isomerase FkpA
MKKLILALLVITCGLASCKKDNNQGATDDAAIQAYIKTNNIPAIKDPSGLYYQIITQGTGVNATATSTVSVNYTGSLLNGTVFDKSTSTFTTSLQSVIKGWTIGVPLVKAGGRILLIIPSALGYGNSATGSIPANSVLVFTIDVITVR